MSAPDPRFTPVLTPSARNLSTVLLESPEQTHMRHLQQAVARCEQIAAYHRERKNAGHTSQLRHAEQMVKLARQALERAVC